MKRNLVFTGVLIATALAAMEATIVSTAAPSIASDLSNLEMISWIFSVYMLASAISAPIMGKLADIYGIKKLFIIGMTIFLIGSLGSGIATTMNQLIVFRAIQGFGGGAVFPICRTIIGTIFKNEKERAKAQGWDTAIYGIAGVVGPLLGGFLVDMMSWRYIFLLTLPIGVMASIFIVAFYQEELDDIKHKIDYAGAITFAISAISLIFVLSEGMHFGWTDPIIIGLAAIGIISLITFILIERKEAEPLIPLSLFRDRGVVLANVLTLFVGALSIGVITYIPTWGQAVMGNSASQSGLMLTPYLILWTCGSFIVGFLVGKLQSSKIMKLGATSLIIGTLLLTFANGNTPDVLIYFCTALLGLGMGLIVPLLIVYIQSNVSEKELGSAMGLNSFVNTLSQSVGVTIFGAIYSIFSNNGTEIGIHAIFTGAVILAIITFATTLLLKNKDSQQEN
ncbi:MDR family MFS transporter [Staphylococcus saprophyticus]|uniref:MDR family MFS transporter n=1 Tax=Staphylococcus saprophyticus TaxID=29385 RepID=UPI001D178A22|nr:MDR family MFS transporter [Staphylococcus saprophyticus]MCC4221866.1 MFS transporter [Staphylococcus saprophyticus]